ncbi:hypothetical protein [Halorubellus sp. PRR65]|uniref:hypothetical protein n=1 Tax=Halorubellus sp. PRR65 TaxID=3098148 RepID=UPI002B262D53|nr:hypothetical protein [Halorubellus sp. PRR65]
MIERASAAALFALYQVTIAMGIALLPLALITRRFGFTLPVDRLVEATEHAYEHTAP